MIQSVLAHKCFVSELNGWMNDPVPAALTDSHRHAAVFCRISLSELVFTGCIWWLSALAYKDNVCINNVTGKKSHSDSSAE